jgi:uncharacterized repeat protein (TIGR01451 family)
MTVRLRLLDLLARRGASRRSMLLLLTIIVAPRGIQAAAQEVVPQGGIEQATAQETVAMETRLIAEVREESAASGNPARYFVPATLLEEGREVFYTVRIRNPGAEFARDVVVVQRIPQNTTYVPDSAAGPGAEISFSVDGGQSFGAEGQLTFTDQAGISRPATAQDYTHIRWRLRNPLAPGAVALARFRAIFR